MLKPKETRKNSTEFYSAEKRAELEVLISKIDYDIKRIDQTLGVISSLTVYIACTRSPLGRYFTSQGLNLFNTTLSSFLDEDNVHSEMSLLVLSIFIGMLNYYYIGPWLYDRIKTLSPALLNLLDSVDYYNKIENAVRVAENPLAQLSVIDKTVAELSTLADKLKKAEFLYFYGPLVFALLQMSVILTFFYASWMNFRDIITNDREFIVGLVFLTTLTLPIWKETHTVSKIAKKQRHLQSQHHVLLEKLIQDLPDITLKGRMDDLGYTPLLFKTADFKTIRNLRLNGKDYFLSYKDIFEGILYCINLVKSMKITKMDKHCIILSADTNYEVNYTSNELRLKLLYFLEHKHNIIFIKDKLLRNLEEATSSLDCDWQAVEKKEEGLPKILFIADVSNLAKKNCDLLHQSLLTIFKDRVKLENNEIIIEPKREDVHSGYAQHYRDLKKIMEGKPLSQPHKKSPPTIYSTPNTFSGGMTGNKNPSKPIETVPATCPPSLPPIATLNSFTVTWSSGTTYLHTIEQAKSLDDDTRIIPMTSGRNNLMLYKRFLIIDPKLKDEIKDKDLYKRYLGCFWKSIPPKSGEQGRKRVITAYRDCHGKQQISEWEVKIPGTDPRAYIRVLDQNNPDAILYIADGWNPHPHKK